MDPQIQAIIIEVLSIETKETKDTIEKAMIARALSQWGAKRSRAKYLTNSHGTEAHKRVG